MAVFSQTAWKGRVVKQPSSSLSTTAGRVASAKLHGTDGPVGVVLERSVPGLRVLLGKFANQTRRRTPEVLHDVSAGSGTRAAASPNRCDVGDDALVVGRVDFHATRSLVAGSGRVGAGLATSHGAGAAVRVATT